MIPAFIANSFIRGEESAVYLVWNDGYTKIFGTTSVDIDYQRESVDVTTRIDAGFKRTMPALRSATLKIELNRILGDSTQEIFYSAWNGADNQLSLLAYDCYSGKAILGDFAVTSISEKQSKGELVTWSISTESCGPFDRIDTPASD